MINEGTFFRSSSPRAVPQAGEYPDFALHTLGWKSFQDLVASIGSEVLGQTFQVFLPSKDAGRDGAFCGEWKASANELLSGSFVAQCKFTNKANATLSPADIKTEIEKARKLASKGLADNYLLFTNLGISGPTDAKLRKQFEEIPGINAFRSYGRDWLIGQIRSSRRLRMLVPRIYGLGDLSQILDERQYRQAVEILSSMQHDLAKFVITDAHRRSANAILDHGFVFLLGEPASGKSTIGASLALGAIDNWKCSTLKARNAEEFVKYWNPDEPNQFFWIDDVFGPNQYQGSLAHQWNAALLHLSAAIKKGTRVLFTSRDYIYRAALRDLKVGAFPLMTESKVIINVQQLTLPEKNQILYNHVKLGSQPKTFKGTIKHFLPTVSKNPLFLPETARRLADPLFTRKLLMTSESVTHFVEHPLEWLKEVINTLDAQSKSALGLIFMAGGSLESPISLTEPFIDKALKLLGGTIAGVRQALGDMNGSLVNHIQARGTGKWVYKHPTIGDALAAIVAEDPELVDIYVRGTPIDKLCGEAVCGDASVEGAKVVIPPAHYGNVANALSQLQREPRLTFLAQRCGREFLCKYIEVTPTIWDELLAFNRLFTSPEIMLLARLQEVELLPARFKTAATRRVVDLSVQMPDSDFLDPAKLRNLFSSEETDAMFKEVLERLMPEIDDLIDNWDSGFNSAEDEPISFFAPLLDCLRDFYDRTHDPELERLLRDAISSAESALENTLSNYEAHPDPEYYDDHYDRDAPHTGDRERDMFDDVDE
jgi:hypothetical protein